MIDINLLRIMSTRADYDKLISAVGPGVLEEKADRIVKAYGKYFETFDHTTVDWTVFLPRFQAWNPALSADDMTVYVAILRQAMKPVDDATRSGISNDLHELNMATELANMAHKFNEGDLPDLAVHVDKVLEDYRSALDIKGLDWLQDDIGDLLTEAEDSSGWKWRLEAINKIMRGLRPGDFGIIAARPDQGKTTMVASEVTFMANQLDKDQNVLWLNNEGPGSRIRVRLYQSALGVTIPDMIQLRNKGTLEQEYASVVGRPDKIRVFDVHGFNTTQVEKILDKNDPGIVVYDMIDNIRGFGNMPRNDLILEEMYKWGRELSVRYGCAGIATSQASADAEGLQYPTQSMLKDSKTGKQGACDFIMFAGASNDPGLRLSRFIGVPKNKLRKVGATGNPGEVLIDLDRARYVDIQTELYEEQHETE